MLSPVDMCTTIRHPNPPFSGVQHAEATILDMSSFPLRRSLAAAAIVTSLFLTACGGTEPEETTTPTPSEAMTSEPMESATPEETMEASPSETAESAAPVVVTGPLEGEALNEAGVAWFTAYCSGLTTVLADSEPDTTGLGKDEVIAKVVETYGLMGGNFTAYSANLATLSDDMNFENSDAFAAEVSDIFKEVGQVYWAGADKMESSTFSSEQEFTAAIEDVSSSIIDAGGFDFGIPTLDATVSTAVAEQAPACASL